MKTISKYSIFKIPMGMFFYLLFFKLLFSHIYTEKILFLVGDVAYAIIICLLYVQFT
jgi:hypothetical protein